MILSCLWGLNNLSHFPLAPLLSTLYILCLGQAWISKVLYVQWNSVPVIVHMFYFSFVFLVVIMVTLNRPGISNRNKNSSITGKSRQDVKQPWRVRTKTNWRQITSNIQSEYCHVEMQTWWDESHGFLKRSQKCGFYIKIPIFMKHYRSKQRHTFRWNLGYISTTLLPLLQVIFK